MKYQSRSSSLFLALASWILFSVVSIPPEDHTIEFVSNGTIAYVDCCCYRNYSNVRSSTKITMTSKSANIIHL
ncbi:hypothetical protein J3F84DRAFT_355174 [Trichoderma pleuroticola]